MGGFAAGGHWPSVCLVAVNDDPERLVAEALRAQAARTPLPATDLGPVPPPGGPSHGSGDGRGQISGNELDRIDHSADLDATTSQLGEADAGEGVVSSTNLGLIALFAVLLGLAAGAVVGLVTLL